MPTTREHERKSEQNERAELKTRIKDQVISDLGQPPDLHGVQVRPLWDDYYRVNVLRGADVTCARIANSYFVQTDQDGKIVGTTPKITRQY